MTDIHNNPRKILDFKFLEKTNSLVLVGIFSAIILFQITAPWYLRQDFPKSFLGGGGNVIMQGLPSIMSMQFIVDINVLLQKILIMQFSADLNTFLNLVLKVLYCN